MATQIEMSVEQRIRTLRGMDYYSVASDAELAKLAQLPLIQFALGEILLPQDEEVHRSLIVLTGKIRFFSSDATHGQLTHMRSDAPLVTGDVGLHLGGRAPFTCEATEAGVAIEIGPESYWSLIAECPGIRSAVLRSVVSRMGTRLEMNLREQKLASLGTLTAGLMHEINNPGAAAGRASQQLRENLSRMHVLAKQLSQVEHSPEQGRCLWEMQEQVLGRKRIAYLNTLEQSDAEETLAEWMDANGIKEAWRLAPTFAASGIGSADLQCLKNEFPSDGISEALAWVEAMVSSMQMVDTIEESIQRVSSLVLAVKTYTHEGNGNADAVDVNASIFATMAILKHKMREHNITLLKSFGDDLPPVPPKKGSLNQVWTNLIDNAIDAAGESGQVTVKTWKDNGEVFVSVADNGPGVPQSCQAHIFDPFFTTKPAGVGTGLGLSIAYQIVHEYGGELHFASTDQGTEFVVHLPVKA